ncbi:hypothetical protein J6590_042593 [Homalodisca vitripennis]|nr:hypothetical protein J6590_042593 [Homalodisca vitripennis]
MRQILMQKGCFKDGLYKTKSLDWEYAHSICQSEQFSYTNTDTMVLPLQSEMKNPEKFSTPLGVLNVGNLIVTVLLLSTGFIGYLKYGEAVEGSLTLNLPYESILSQFVKITIAIGMLLTYPIVMYVPHTIIWPAIVKRWGPFERKILYEYLKLENIEISSYIGLIVMAEVVPNLYVFISLVGAVSSTALALVFPPFFVLAKVVPNLYVFISLVGAVSSTALALVFPPLFVMAEVVPNLYVFISLVGAVSSTALALVRVGQVVLAEVVPNLSVFISLVGAVSSTALALVFPPLCDLSIRWKHQDFGTLRWRMAVDFITLVVAIFGFCTGTYYSLVEITIKAFTSEIMWLVIVWLKHLRPHPAGVMSSARITSLTASQGLLASQICDRFGGIVLNGFLFLMKIGQHPLHSSR